MDIFRGRYRESFSHPTAIPANTPQRYRFDLPNVNHVFHPGHRIMVQIQSTLFPLYDRNPQTFVPNIFFAKPADYRKAEITILRSKSQSTAVWLPVVKGRSSVLRKSPTRVPLKIRFWGCIEKNSIKDNFSNPSIFAQDPLKNYSHGRFM